MPYSTLSHAFNRRNALRLAAGSSAATLTTLLSTQAAQADEAAKADNSLVDQFISQKQFVIAHRGAGDVNPEHTAYAYQQAILKGAQAVEISVRSTSDGVMVCMHDNALSRTTTASGGYVSTTSFAELKAHFIDMRAWLGSGTPPVNIVGFEDTLNVLAATKSGGSYNSVGNKAILFIEAKDSASQKKMLDLLSERKMQNRVVIKIYRNGRGAFDPEISFVRYAKEAGFKTWCYFDAEDSLEDIKKLADSDLVDMLGVPFFETIEGRESFSMTDQQISDLVKLGKPVIAWEVHRRSVMKHLASLGVRGFMSPDPYWLSGSGMPADLALAAGRRLHGMLPAGSHNIQNMPIWDKDKAELVHQQAYDESFLLGPLSHLISSSKGSYVIKFTVGWKDLLPTNDWQFGYMAFGRADDSAFGLGKKFNLDNSQAGCYLLAIRPGSIVADENGDWQSGDIIQLLRMDAGNRTPIPLATLKPQTPFAANQEIDCKIIVRPESLVIDVAGSRSKEVRDTRYRGSFVHFGRWHGASHGGPFALSKVKTYKI